QEHAVIDYKKGSLPGKDEVFPDVAGKLASPQMAAYINLCEASGRTVAQARYWSVEKAEALVVLGPGARSREEYSPALKAFERDMGVTAGLLRAGDFRPNRLSNRDCGSCGWKAVCRTAYAAEVL
ncbi:MAG TPA: PD-(D/E)XK nuclease family protein, partial [Magnetospirillaceae bacterium]|nr:PD-(D/E)XK nuclease family protein [Magnetospirillaceae bacterium]